MSKGHLFGRLAILCIENDYTLWLLVDKKVFEIESFKEVFFQILVTNWTEGMPPIHDSVSWS